jgi:hypothetical protein
MIKNKYKPKKENEVKLDNYLKNKDKDGKTDTSSSAEHLQEG